MKIRYLPFLASLLLLTAISNPLFADPDRLTSQEWLGMPENQRMEYVMMGMDQLKFKDVPLSRSAAEYLREIDDLFAKKPGMTATAVSVILPSLVYANEPGSREILDKLIKNHDLEKIERL